MSKTRDLNRHHAERKKTRVKKIVVLRGTDPGDASFHRQVYLTAATPVPCSCWMCGNPRKHLKGVDAVTVQERRARHAALEDT